MYPAILIGSGLGLLWIGLKEMGTKPEKVKTEKVKPEIKSTENVDTMQKPCQSPKCEGENLNETETVTPTGEDNGGDS